MWDCRKIGLLICVSTSHACQKQQRFTSTYCHSRAGEVERLERKLKDLKSGLAQCWQVSRYPTCTTKHFLTWLFDDSEVIRRIRTDFTAHLQTCTDSQVFVEMDANVQVIDTRPSLLLPRGLGTRLVHCIDLGWVAWVGILHVAYHCYFIAFWCQRTNLCTLFTMLLAQLCLKYFIVLLELVTIFMHQLQIVVLGGVNGWQRGYL